MQITAALSRVAGQDLTLETLALGPLRDDEVLVRVVATGICHTDIGMRDSPSRIPRPMVLGHEGAGVVVSTGKAVNRIQAGDHVVMSFDTCGTCHSCVSGKVAYCSHLGAYNFAGQRLDGSTALSVGQEAVHSHFFGQSSFATHAVCHERNAVVVDADLPLELLGPLGCGFQTGAGAVLNSLGVSAGQTLAVLGTGAVGLAAVMAARIAGATTLVAVDTNNARLELATELGATHVINGAREEVFTRLRAIVPQGVNFALDTTGNLDLIRQATQNLAPLGVCGLINTARGADLSANILSLVLGGHSVRGIHQGDSDPQRFIPELISLYRQGRFPFDRLLSFYELADINVALSDMHEGRSIKPVIRMPT
ncbi:NAD(P)-dependent alcohol dehydrogenase [Pusillimonas sp. CC-YST705]|uniref:NAD(P)-dependent alcohol dehydrogenase n=1 Tax=Mesopusillimonas faecipullorum TaxID=2755040 RepID=A0ABS8CBL9_9BURK|nr:NAD(P)-dependent alcohol dehydrogenase [Mesopusillimonas faecipullorum]MCB5363426.1 NAD(P)-dependent alcohol dehydrogenase [Mesopusillimonas faecipullorum]